MKNQDAIDAANKVLNENYLTQPPIRVWEITQNYGLYVFYGKFEDSQVPGYLDLSIHQIIVNEDHSYAEQLFAMSWFLGHWILHPEKVEGGEVKRVFRRKPLASYENELEEKANVFAAYLLIPEEIFKKNEQLPDNELAHLCEVHQSLIGYRRALAHGR